jgi:hypothetical protein
MQVESGVDSAYLAENVTIMCRILWTALSCCRKVNLLEWIFEVVCLTVSDNDIC